MVLTISDKLSSRKESALAWVQDLAEGKYEITNFSSCFADGLAFCAVLHGLYPDEVPYEELTPEDQERNFTLAFKVHRSVAFTYLIALQVAEEHGVAPLLDVEDMVSMRAPDPRSVMTYVFEMHRILGKNRT